MRTQLEEKFKRFHEGKEVTITGEEYVQAGKLGLTCSIVGCETSRHGNAQDVGIITARNTNPYIFAFKRG